MICPLCVKPSSFTAVEGPDARSYYLCETCLLIFTDTSFLPTRAQEAEHYRKHENGIQYKGYVNFLNKAIQPALPFLEPGMEGLDYGCGPVPTLSLLLKESGYEVDDYDPYFFPEFDEDKKYDFIFATECFEHFFFPARDLQRLRNLLKENGLLIVMTERWKEVKDFKRWYYAKDLTHVAFYHMRTFDAICSKFGFERQFIDDRRVVILQRKTATEEKEVALR
ncbi:class I SAM-dependent methyltransferase [Pontibacter pamirensis]|uniref:class I SAM-dependent methyltransferase n=1 Tax=Pontibacter pamirensis TaxID=2562824 RepID=UPI001389A9D4|nr:class I SAM-dependent methyltransferase [Pontibacter pamirensis]